MIEPIYWQPIATAPIDGHVVVLTEAGWPVRAFWDWVAGAPNPTCAWHAAHEDQHPPSWEDGICWEGSDHPVLWVPLPQEQPHE